MPVTAKALLLCQLVYEDPVSHLHTLLGVFTGIRVVGFPTRARELSAYALLEGGAGEHGNLMLQCLEEQTENIYFDEVRQIQIGQDGKRHVHIRLSDVRFPRPGAYRFVLRFKGEKIAEQTVLLREA